MYPTRSSARIQQEKDIEHNNQMLSFFNGEYIYNYFLLNECLMDYV